LRKLAIKLGNAEAGILFFYGQLTGYVCTDSDVVRHTSTTIDNKNRGRERKEEKGTVLVKSEIHDKHPNEL